jgi:hypothetical protein
LRVDKQSEIMLEVNRQRKINPWIIQNGQQILHREAQARAAMKICIKTAQARAAVKICIKTTSPVSEAADRRAGRSFARPILSNASAAMVASIFYISFGPRNCACGA